VTERIQSRDLRAFLPEMPDLTFPRSDGDKRNVPSSELKAEKVSLSGPASIVWRRKVGIEVATALGHESAFNFFFEITFANHVIECRRA
jgi:hypothetical protein